MPKNDEGEFELVLGNRQLLTVFAIVVVLLGVFFAMGFVVGRNSSPAENARNEKAKPDHDESTDTANPDTAATADQPATPPASDSTSGAASVSTPPATPPEITKPAQAQPPPPAPTKPAPVPAKETKPKPSPAAVAARPPVHAAAAGEPSSGQYWQVVATARPDAEIIAEALGKKGFHVVVAPGPREGIFRVLVGPLADASALAQTRTGLESAGFKNPLIRKY